jgi:hypothetical protein
MSRNRRSDDSQNRRESPSKFRVGDIQDSTGIAIGNGAYAAVNQPRLSVQDEVVALLDHFIHSLGLYGDSMSDAQGVRQSAAAARAEVARPSPKWQAVRRMLTTIAAGVAGVAALTDAINNIQALVAHIVD